MMISEDEGSGCRRRQFRCEWITLEALCACFCLVPSRLTTKPSRVGGDFQPRKFGQEYLLYSSSILKVSYFRSDADIWSVSEAWQRAAPAVSCSLMLVAFSDGTRAISALIDVVALQFTFVIEHDFDRPQHPDPSKKPSLPVSSSSPTHSHYYHPPSSSSLLLPHSSLESASPSPPSPMT